MKISDVAWKGQQRYELDYTLKYQWKEDWKKIYRHYLKDFFEIDGCFPDKVVVDVGCGPIGVISVIEAKKRVGMDPLMDEYKKIYEMEPGVEYFKSKAEDIKLPKNYADIVFYVNVLNHVQDPEKTLAEIARILKPFGTMYFDVHENPVSVGHPHLFREKQLVAMLRRHFKIERVIRKDKTLSISYDVYCANCRKKLLLRQQYRPCPYCGKIERRLKKRVFTSKTKVWGAVCTPEKEVIKC